jgi:magnesium transporter
MSSVHPSALFVPELKQLLKSKNYSELKQDLADINLVDLADGWSQFAPSEQTILFKLLPVDRSEEIFEELEVPEQMHLLNTLELGSLGPALEGIKAEEQAVLFHKLPDKTVRKMMAMVRRASGERAQPSLTFPERTAGRLMRPALFDLRPQQTVHQALERIRAGSRLHWEHEPHAFYVTDDTGRLLGALNLPALIAAPQNMKLAELMTPVQLIKVRAETDQEEAAKFFSKYNLVAAPVVNAENKLLGVLSVDDILKVVSQEATEDIAKMAGTGAEELETGSIVRVARLRMPWLLASWGGGVLASVVITRFERTLSEIVALAAFMPVISGMGGNVGTQSSTIVVRGLATGHIQIGEIVRMVWREFRVGLFLGVAYGVLLAILASVKYRSQAWTFPLVVGLGIFTSMTIAAVMGALTPMVVKRFNVDPALCSAPFVSTATDIVSLLTYFSIATWLLV